MTESGSLPLPSANQKFNTMVIHSSYPSKNFPLLVQINYGDGSVAFYRAESIGAAIDSYLGNIVAIFKIKTK